MLEFFLVQAAVLVSVVFFYQPFGFLFACSDVELFLVVYHVVCLYHSVGYYVEFGEGFRDGKLRVLADCLPLSLDLYTKSKEKEYLTVFSSSAITLNKSVNRELVCC